MEELKLDCRRLIGKGKQRAKLTLRVVIDGTVVFNSRWSEGYGGEHSPLSRAWLRDHGRVEGIRSAETLAGFCGRTGVEFIDKGVRDVSRKSDL